MTPIERNHILIRRHKMGIKTYIILISSLLLQACASLPIPEKGPVFVSAIPTSMEFTGWFRDFCSNGEFINHVGYTRANGCLNVHHGVHKVRLSNPMDINRKRFKKSFEVAFTGSGRTDFHRWNNKEWHLVLQLTQDDFFEETGLRFFAQSSLYDTEENCFDVTGYLHSDYRICPDREFHIKHQKSCISYDLLIDHFSE